MFGAALEFTFNRDISKARQETLTLVAFRKAQTQPAHLSRINENECHAYVLSTNLPHQTVNGIVFFQVSFVCSVPANKSA